MPAVQVTALSKSFHRGSRALDDVSFAVETAEMVALIGASGSGKSTLLRHIAGLVGGDRHEGEGRVEVFGAEIQSSGRLHRQCRRLRANIGFVFQQFHLVGRLTVMTNVLLGALGRIPAWRGSFGVFTSEERRHAIDALRRVGIAEKAGQRASTLSGGQQQRAAIARTLMQRAQLVLADEPIASLDPASATKVMETLARINREDGITVLVSLHQVDYAVRYCPRTIAMLKGRIVYDGPSTGLTPAFLAELYGSERQDGPADDSARTPGALAMPGLAYVR
jgi:phosphonate transport system ATP-binding protein